MSDANEFRENSGIVDSQGAASGSAPGREARRLLALVRSKAEVVEQLLDLAKANRELAEHLEREARRAPALRDEAASFERAARQLVDDDEPATTATATKPRPKAPTPCEEPATTATTTATKPGTKALAQRQAPATTAKTATAPRPTKPTEEPGRSLRDELAELVEADLTAEEMAQRRGVTRSAIDQALAKWNARPRMQGQPKGTEPRPHIGRLRDATAEPAPRSFECPSCGRECTSRSWSHLMDCAWSPPSVRATRTIARLLTGGWAATEIAEASGIDQARVGAIHAGRDVTTPEESAALNRLLDEPIPTLPHRGTVANPTQKETTL